MRIRCLALFLAVLLLVPAVSRGAGFSIYEQGARALGSGGAYTARVGDASGIFFNPAGLARIEGGELELGTSLIYVTREFAGVNPYPGFGVHEESPNQAFLPSHLYWGQRLNPNVVVGFGVYNPFGLTTEWSDPDAFSGRFLSTKVSVTPFFFQPTVAVSFGPRLRVGVGLMAVHTSLELRRHVGQPNPAGLGVLDMGTVQLNGDNGLDFGGAIGFQAEVAPGVTMAASYRSNVGIGYDGTADFTFVGTGTPLDPTLKLLFPGDQDVHTNLDFPASLILGLAVKPSSRLSLEGDLGWMQWTSFGELSLQFEDEELNTTMPEGWEDAFFYRFGAEYALNASTDLRFGYYYDETPQPTEAISPLLPDNNRHGVSLGLGKSWGRWSVDAFGLVLIIPDRDTEGVNRDGFEGTYSNGVQIGGVTVGYRY